MPNSPPNPVAILPSDDFGVERVFPIRNLVGDGAGPFERQRGASQESQSRILDHESSGERRNSASTASSRSRCGSTESLTRHIAVAPIDPEYSSPPYPPIPPEDTIRRLSFSQPDFEAEVASPEDGDGGQLRRISERSQMVPSNSGPPGVLLSTGADDGKATVYRCEDEPIHVPGAIQSYGALVAVRYDEEGNLKVRITSENVAKLLKLGPEELFQLASFLDLLEAEAREDLVARIGHALGNAGRDSESTNLDILSISTISPGGTRIPLWCAIHVSQGSTDLVILEFEKYSDRLFLDGFHDKGPIPEEESHTIADEVIPEERLKSTTNYSQSLRVLGIARRKELISVPSMDIFNAMTESQRQLAGCTSVQQVFDTVVGLISEVSGFHRVMFYRFDSEKNGCVEAELLDPKASNDIFRGRHCPGLMANQLLILTGLHFPASDIPKQARDLYVINRIRLLYDRDEETARLVCDS